ncbi:hypothetical protein OIU76_005174, partial [Salix suchowensis]
MEAAAAARDLVSSRTGAQTITTSSSSSSAPLLPYNLPLLSALLACALAQFLKLFTTWYKEKRWDSKRMLDSGGNAFFTLCNRHSSCSGCWFARRVGIACFCHCCCLGLC